MRLLYKDNVVQEELMGKFTVLFGAGVEGCFHLPLGSDYTKETILSGN